jgi:hypothetical protein
VKSGERRRSWKRPTRAGWVGTHHPNQIPGWDPPKKKTMGQAGPQLRTPWEESIVEYIEKGFSGVPGQQTVPFQLRHLVRVSAVDQAEFHRVWGAFKRLVATTTPTRGRSNQVNFRINVSHLAYLATFVGPDPFGSALMPVGFKAMGECMGGWVVGLVCVRAHPFHLYCRVLAWAPTKPPLQTLCRAWGEANRRRRLGHPLAYLCSCGVL